jgi:hypothetical protein
VSEEGHLRFRERRWVLVRQNLQTCIIQTVHNSTVAGHPGQEGTYAFIARQFYWPGIAKNVRFFTDSCDSCGANKQWRKRRRGFLKPLPIPDRLWSKISIDFIKKLPESEDCQNIIVVTDQLGKRIVADGLPDLKVKTVAK